MQFTTPQDPKIICRNGIVSFCDDVGSVIFQDTTTSQRLLGQGSVPVAEADSSVARSPQYLQSLKVILSLGIEETRIAIQGSLFVNPQHGLPDRSSSQLCPQIVHILNKNQIHEPGSETGSVPLSLVNIGYITPAARPVLPGPPAGQCYVVLEVKPSLRPTTFALPPHLSLVSEEGHSSSEALMRLHRVEVFWLHLLDDGTIRSYIQGEDVAADSDRTPANGHKVSMTVPEVST